MLAAVEFVAETFLITIAEGGGEGQFMALKGLSHQFESGYKWYGWKEEK